MVSIKNIQNSKRKVDYKFNEEKLELKNTSRHAISLFVVALV